MSNDVPARTPFTAGRLHLAESVAICVHKRCAGVEASRPACANHSRARTLPRRAAFELTSPQRRAWKAHVRRRARTHLAEDICKLRLVKSGDAFVRSAHARFCRSR